MKRHWNRMPKTEEVGCFGHVRIDDVNPLSKEEKRNVSYLPSAQGVRSPHPACGLSSYARGRFWPRPLRYAYSCHLCA